MKGAVKESTYKYCPSPKNLFTTKSIILMKIYFYFIKIIKDDTRSGVMKNLKRL